MTLSIHVSGGCVCVCVAIRLILPNCHKLIIIFCYVTIESSLEQAMCLKLLIECLLEECLMRTLTSLVSK